MLYIALIIFLIYLMLKRKENIIVFLIATIYICYKSVERYLVVELDMPFMITLIFELLPFLALFVVMYRRREINE